MQKLARDLRPLPIALICVTVTFAFSCDARAAAVQPVDVAFPTSDGGEIHAHLYGEGDHAVVLAHGAVFDKESWTPLATKLAEADLKVLAIDFRGYGRSRPGSEGEARYLDVLAAISYLKEQGTSRVSVVGASMGGGAVARAGVLVGPGEIDRLILLAPVAIPNPEKLHANRIVYLTAEGDPSLSRTRQQYERAPEPKTLEVLSGDAHAQHLFKTDHSQALVDLILAALAD